MAVPRLLCGKCGSGLLPGQNECAQCGEPVELHGASPATVACPVCGQKNPAGSGVCSSCGVRLGAKRPKGQRKGPKGVPPGGRKRFEPWQAASIVAVLGLLAFVVYLEWGSGPPGPAAGAPAGPAAAVPPGMPGLHTHAPDLGPLEAAVQANPRDPAALLRLANGQHDAGQFTTAIATYGRYLDVRPDDPDARVDRGICYFELARTDTTGAEENFRAAVREMKTALDRNPSHQPAAFNLGVVHLSMGHIEESRSWLTKAAAMNENSDLGKRARTMLEQHSF